MDSNNEISTIWPEHVYREALPADSPSRTDKFINSRESSDIVLPFSYEQIEEDVGLIDQSEYYYSKEKRTAMADLAFNQAWSYVQEYVDPDLEGKFPQVANTDNPKSPNDFGIKVLYIPHARFGDFVNQYGSGEDLSGAFAMTHAEFYSAGNGEAAINIGDKRLIFIKETPFDKDRINEGLDGGELTKQALEKHSLMILRHEFIHKMVYPQKGNVMIDEGTTQLLAELSGSGVSPEIIKEWRRLGIEPYINESYAVGTMFIALSEATGISPKAIFKHLCDQKQDTADEDAIVTFLYEYAPTELLSIAGSFLGRRLADSGQLGLLSFVSLQGYVNDPLNANNFERFPMMNGMVDFIKDRYLK